ncbi:MAG TPA: hypothetical protein VFC31_12205 [Candidatus Limnocylindria bacterium]|nr:hypothetical protein [Candidatus Limnocylindria bacterium]
MDDRTLRIAVLLSAHLFLSAAALRVLHGRRGYQLVTGSAWWIQYYPPLVWLPFLLAYLQPLPTDLDRSVRYAGLSLCVASGAFAAWAMWSLGKSYGIRMDIFVLIATLVYVVPLTAIRIAREERVPAEAFGERYAAYQRDVPVLLPYPG